MSLIALSSISFGLWVENLSPSITPVMIRSGVFCRVLKVTPPSSLCCHLCEIILGDVPDPTNIVSELRMTFTVAGFLVIVTVSPAST